MLLSGWDGLGSLAMLPLFAAPTHECFYDWDGDEDYPGGMGLPQAKPHIEKPCNGGCWIDAFNELR